MPFRFAAFPVLALAALWLSAGTVEAAAPNPILSPNPAARAVAVSAIVVTAPAQMSAAIGDTIYIEATAESGDPNAIITMTVTGAPAELTFATNTPTSIGAMASLSGAVQTHGAWWIDWRAEDQFGVRKVATTLLTVLPPDGPPVLGMVSSMSVYVNDIAYANLTATDPDGDPLTFSLVSGPSFVTVVTDNQGSGSASGRAIVSPGSSDQGNWNVTVRVSDGAREDTGSFTVTVLAAPTQTPPFFSPYPTNMTVNEGAVADQTLTAIDPDGNPLSFFKSSGPAFMSVTTTNPGSGTATGNLRLAPGPVDEGSYFGDVYVTDGIYYGFAYIYITIVHVPSPPVPGEPFWEVVGPFQDPRTGGAGVNDAAASLIGDKLYVSHGARYGESVYLSFFDIAQSAWTHGGVSAPDAAFQRTALAGGRALGRHYAIGGRSSPTSVEEFDPVTERWTTKAPLPVGRAGLGAASWNGKIYVVGGRSGYSYGEGTIYNRLDVYDAATNQWANRASMPVPVSENGATVAYQGKVYVFGGWNGASHVATTQIYDIATNTWRLGAAMPTPRGASRAGVVGSKIAVFGGYAGGSRYLPVTEMYDPGTDTWSPGNEMPQTLYGLAQGATFDHTGAYALGTNASGYSGVLMVLRPHVSLNAPLALQQDEGQPVSFQVTASHRNALPVTLRATGLPPGASFTDHGDGSGTFAWTPGFDQAGSYSLTFTGSSGDGSTNTMQTSLAVRNRNRGPSADPGGPYTGTAGAPLQLDGTGSSDPDGTPLTYSWIFGDGSTGTGASPSHTYAASGTYGIALTVFDEGLSDLSTTTATIVDLFQARAFTAGGGRTIRLGGGKPTWCVQVEPVGGSFSLNLVHLESIVMKSAGTGDVGQITAVVDKSSVGSDRDGNGLDEITACFGKDDLRVLFSGIHGTQTVPVTIEGQLFNGGRFVCAIDVAVHASGGGPSASVSPNPLNPDATLTFHVPAAGPARVRIYGPDGRLVRQLLDGEVSAGYHDLRFDGKDTQGTRLSSGVYFYRVETVAGSVGGRLAIVK
ncbi:MAG TPA: PKD domain-containing protein [Candidatus Eisenbacteria bacterium]|nr:PKD domain-containing protein [Candidatus Eisenbacteria bacterium]